MNTEVEEILQTKNVKPTPIRVLVLAYLLQQKTASGLGDLEAALDKADRITIYRTLKTFEEKGIIHAVHDRSEAKYALCEAACDENVHSDMHVHFHCIKCKELYCLPKTQIPEITLPEKFHVSDMSLIVRGTCNRCQRK